VTTTANLADLRHDIGFETLPAALRDAVHAAKALSIEYLWIDSLCIVQDSVEDFLEESKRYDEIFNGAYFVLSATSSTGVHDGFLRERPSRTYHTLERSPNRSLYVCEFIDNFDRDVSESALYKRAWTLQDRIFARRTIFFTKTQLYWECGHGIRCETMTRMARSDILILTGMFMLT
jgi:hypothetical protein